MDEYQQKIDKLEELLAEAKETIFEQKRLIERLQEELGEYGANELLDSDNEDYEYWRRS